MTEYNERQNPKNIYEDNGKPGENPPHHDEVENSGRAKRTGKNNFSKARKK
jgi:hypothetical protein